MGPPADLVRLCSYSYSKTSKRTYVQVMARAYARRLKQTERGHLICISRLCIRYYKREVSSLSLQTCFARFHHRHSLSAAVVYYLFLLYTRPRVAYLLHSLRDILLLYLHFTRKTGFSHFHSHSYTIATLPPTLLTGFIGYPHDHYSFTQPSTIQAHHTYRYNGTPIQHPHPPLLPSRPVYIHTRP